MKFYEAFEYVKNELEGKTLPLGEIDKINMSTDQFYDGLSIDTLYRCKVRKNLYSYNGEEYNNQVIAIDFSFVEDLERIKLQNDELDDFEGVVVAVKKVYLYDI